MKRLVAVSFFFALFTGPALANPEVVEQAAEKPPEAVRIMIVGAYHFANPGADLNNVVVDDVLQPKRQKELTALASALKTFKPTAVAVEARAKPPYDDPGYQKFTPEALSQQRNETLQIGYRTAHAAGVQRVYAIDEQPSEGEPDYFPYDRVMKQAKVSGQSDELEKMSDFGSVMHEFEDMQKTESIPDLLAYWNSGKIPDTFYWDIITIGKGEAQTGAELAAYWFLRNAKIFNKLTQVTKPGDRVIVVYGSGHLAWLREIIEKTPGYELEPVLPYLEKASDLLSH